MLCWEVLYDSICANLCPAGGKIFTTLDSILVELSYDFSRDHDELVVRCTQLQKIKDSADTHHCNASSVTPLDICPLVEFA